METLVRLDGIVEQVLERLVKDGYYKTKAEAIRAGLLELGREYSLIGGRSEHQLVSERIAEMKSELKSGKKKLVPIEDAAAKSGIRI